MVIRTYEHGWFYGLLSQLTSDDKRLLKIYVKQTIQDPNSRKDAVASLKNFLTSEEVDLNIRERFADELVKTGDICAPLDTLCSSHPGVFCKLIIKRRALFNWLQAYKQDALIELMRKAEKNGGPDHLEKAPKPAPPPKKLPKTPYIFVEESHKSNSGMMVTARRPYR